MTLRQRLSALLASILCLLIFLPALAQASDVAVVYNPDSNDRLHLRAKASKDAASLGRYYNGTPLEVLRTQGDWVYVRIGNIYGYMLHEYLLLGGSEGSVPSAMPIGVVSNPVPTDRLNLRESPSEKAQSLAKYANGTVVEILGDAEDWVHVRIGGNTGYMKREYLSITGGRTSSSTTSRPSSGPSVTPAPVTGQAFATVNNPLPSSHLVLRESPSKDSKSLASCPNGTVVEILGTSGLWYHVNINGATGYMLAEFLLQDSAYPDKIPLSLGRIKAGIPYGTILRTYPSNDAHIAETLPAGATLTILGKAGTWYYVRNTETNAYGYVPSHLLDVGSDRAPAGDLVYGIVRNPNPQERLNLRPSASMGARYMGKLFNATQVEILDFYQPKNAGWYRVRVGTVEGYVKAQYIDIVSYGPVEGW